MLSETEFDEIIRIPQKPKEEWQEARDRRDALCAMANPFDRGGYKPRSFPSGKPLGQDSRESMTVPLPSRVPLISESTVPPAEPEPVPAAKPVKRALPRKKAARAPRRGSAQAGPDLVRVPEGWKALEEGIIFTQSAMDLIARRFIVDQDSVVTIAKDMKTTAAVIRAALRANRIPPTRQGRGPVFRPAQPRRKV